MGGAGSRAPDAWEAAAQATGALERRRVFRTATELFQALCCLVVGQCSLQEATAWITLSGGPRVSAVALHKRLKRSDPWFAWILAQLGARAQTPLTNWDRLVLVADTTVITQPGSRGTDWRIHALLNLGDLRWAGCEGSPTRTAANTSRAGPASPATWCSRIAATRRPRTSPRRSRRGPTC